MSLIYKSEMQKKKHKDTELFTGAGGLALGIEKVRFNTIGLIGFKKDAQLRKNVIAQVEGCSSVA